MAEPALSQHFDPAGTLHTWGRREGTDPLPVHLRCVHPYLKGRGMGLGFREEKYQEESRVSGKAAAHPLPRFPGSI